MQKINLHADKNINFNNPDSIDNYAPEDQFEFIPDDVTLKSRFIDFLLDFLIDPLRMQFYYEIIQFVQNILLVLLLLLLKDL